MATNTLHSESVPATAVATNPDADILAAWGRRSVAYAIYNGLPHCDEPGTPYTPEEQAQLDIVDEAEAVINTATAATPQGVAIQLWTGLAHILTNREEEQAINIADLDWFLMDETRFDWGERLILSGIRSLRAMQGSAATAV
ncbi:MAG: hypothetical protein CVT74_02315 [Alphaproteobacteria bacterium HGW-Alphaproteobacteria-13]|jgi:hypothetical protein|nr:MAG: hypothetical protein CVT74_02315 [Alphaproteobacteria bacterium HGW-Alphaproteobacteria-13]